MSMLRYVLYDRMTTPDIETSITDLVIAAQKDSSTVEGNYPLDIEEANLR